MRPRLQVQAILEAWLHPSTCTTPPLTDCGSPKETLRRVHNSHFLSPFQHPLNPDLWVLPDTSAGSEHPPCSEEGDADRWLVKKRNQAQVSSDPLRPVQWTSCVLTPHFLFRSVWLVLPSVSSSPV